jgi:metal-responsive CopG/Arc/MetJ family transcriptional regulator
LSQLQNKAKSRTAVWLYPETMKRMDEMLEKDNVKNRSEFIEKALQFYMSYLNSEGATEYLSKVIVAAMQGLLRETESRHSGNLFRLSVEMSMMMNILAAGLEISDEDLRKLRGRCVNEVKKTKGKISIEEALKFQHGIEE